MSSMKQKIYEKMSNLYDNLMAMCVDNCEIAMINGDMEGVKYWDSQFADYSAKKERFDSKLQESKIQKEEP